MIYITTVTISVTGTAQAIASVNTPASWVTLQADESNASPVYHGPSSVTTSNGQSIASGGGGGSPQYPPLGVNQPYNLQNIYVVGTSGDIVRVMRFLI